MSMRKEEMEKRRNERKEKAKGIKEKREKKRKEEMEKRRKAAKEARNQLKKENKYGFSLFNNNNNASNMDTEEMDERLNEIAIKIEEEEEKEKKEHGLYLEDNNVGNDEEDYEFRRLDNEMENKKLRGKKWTENEEIEKNITDYMKDVGGKTRKTKKVRKHKGIHQTGGNKGRLKKGYKYSGKKLKNGKSEIIKCKSKKC